MKITVHRPPETQNGFLKLYPFFSLSAISAAFYRSNEWTYLNKFEMCEKGFFLLFIYKQNTHVVKCCLNVLPEDPNIINGHLKML